MPYLTPIDLRRTPIVDKTTNREIYTLLNEVRWESRGPTRSGITAFHLSPGITTDFASFPTWIPFSSTVLRDPHCYVEAALPHDFYYNAAGLHGYDREVIDCLFHELLIESAVDAWRAKLMHAGVRAGGRGPWRGHQERNRR